MTRDYHGRYVRRPPADYLEERVDKSGECWVWTGVTDINGYGRLDRLFMHRVAWELANGPISEGLVVCHRCDNPPCVRPDHLFLGTQADNMKDMWAKGRGVVRINARRDLCGRGLHQMSDENVIAYAENPKRGRECRACKEIRNRSRRWNANGYVAVSRDPS